MSNRLTIVAIFFLFALPGVSAKSRDPLQRLVLRTYNNVGLPAGEIETAARVARQVLARAAIEIEWRDCTPDGSCEDQTGPREVLIRFRNAGAGEPTQELGQSYVDLSAMRGTLATIFADRIHGLAGEARCEPGLLLGRVIAHEVGHLLIGPGHSSRGIMRAKWVDGEITLNRPWDWVFSRPEAIQMRNALSESERFSHLSAALVQDFGFGVAHGKD